jgi:chemotaxis protein MotB
MREITMHPTKRFLSTVLFGLLPMLWVGPAYADLSLSETDLSSVKFGDTAQAFFAGFIRPNVTMIGVVAKTADNRSIVGRGDMVYLQMNRSEEVTPGAAYTVYRRIRKVFHPGSRRYLGDLIDVVAVVQVTQVGDDFVSAKVDRSFLSIRPGDGVMPFSPPVQEPSVQELSAQTERTLPEAPGMIIEMQPQRTLIGQSHLVYLDWGQEDGLRVGDRVEVYRKRTGYPTQQIGEVKVLALEDRTASGIVTRSKAAFAVGDRFVIKGPVLADLPQAEHPLSGSRQSAREQLAKSLEAQIARGDVSVQQVGNKIKINLGDLVDQLEYDSGEPMIKPTGLPILKQISEILKTLPVQEIVVEGHTDSMPIGPRLAKRFPSNQELSEARASLIVRYFIEQGLDSQSLTAIGYADRRPVAGNVTEEGRHKNRRIEIELSEKESPQKAADPTPSALQSSDGNPPLLVPPS